MLGRTTGAPARDEFALVGSLAGWEPLSFEGKVVVVVVGSGGRWTRIHEQESEGCRSREEADHVHRTGLPLPLFPSSVTQSCEHSSGAHSLTFSRLFDVQNTNRSRIQFDHSPLC